MSEFRAEGIGSSGATKIILATADLVEYQDAIRSGRVVPMNGDAYETGIDKILGSLNADEQAAVWEKYNQIFIEDMKEE